VQNTTKQLNAIQSQYGPNSSHRY